MARDLRLQSIIDQRCYCRRNRGIALHRTVIHKRGCDYREANLNPANCPGFERSKSWTSTMSRRERHNVPIDIHYNTYLKSILFGLQVASLSVFNNTGEREVALAARPTFPTNFRYFTQNTRIDSAIRYFLLRHTIRFDWYARGAQSSEQNSYCATLKESDEHW